MMHETVANQIVMGTSFWIATTVFLLAYGLIIWDKIHKTIIALFAAALLIVIGIVTQEEAFTSMDIGVDWNVIFLLIGMMIIINIMKPTGCFEYLAIKGAKAAKGQPFMIMVIFSTITAVFSAFLDNVTTVLLIAPVTLVICQALELNIVPFLLTEVLASNIGGTATLIGDPPNIMIGSKAHLGFMPFVYNLSPVIIVVLIAFIISIKFIFGKKMVVKEELRERVMAMDENEAIKDPVLLRKSLVVLALTITGFVTHGALNLEPATIALTGAGLLLLVSGIKDPRHVLAEAEWGAIFFFIGLFIIVGAVVKVGLIKWMAIKVLELTQGNLFGTSMIVMWFSAFASAFIDNIPYVATMNPLIINMAQQLWPDLTGVELLHHPDLMPLWWSLALGACLGGNGTAIGASANVIVCGMAEKMGHPIPFRQWMLYGMPLMIESVIIGMIYVWLRYYVLHI
jgi:Na+/H+ antiporter NhaD/arsenite permease-like protein